MTAQGGRIWTSLETGKGRPVQEHHQATPATPCGDSAIMFVALELRAVPKTQAMTWRSKRLADVNSAASKVITRDMAVLPS